MKIHTSLLLTTLVLASPSLWAADASHGEALFKQECSDCHNATIPGKNRKGPALFGVVNRPNGSLADYNYSDGMRQQHFDWDISHLDAYLAAPKKAIPGGKMKYDGLEDGVARADIIAYLSQNH